MQKVPAKKKLTVCLVTISLQKGGAERSCAILSQLLHNLGYQVFIVTLNSGVDYAYSGTLFDLGKNKPNKNTLLSRVKRVMDLKRFLVKQKVDVIIDHRSKNKYYRELFYAQYVYQGIKKIYVVHSSNLAQYLTDKPKKFIAHCLAKTHLVAVSKYIGNELIKQHGLSRVTTIYNCFLPEWKTGNEEVPSQLQDKKYILSYGRIDDAVKDFSFLLDAYNYSLLWKKGVYLVIMGEGKDKEMLFEKAKQLQIEDWVLFLPFHQNPFPVIKQARVVTLTSKYEGFPMVLIESLSLRTPVISLDIVSGPAEIIKHEQNGLLIPERNVSLFAKALQTMFENETLYNHIKNNTEKSVNDFSATRISKKWEEVLEL